MVTRTDELVIRNLNLKFEPELKFQRGKSRFRAVGAAGAGAGPRPISPRAGALWTNLKSTMASIHIRQIHIWQQKMMSGTYFSCKSAFN